MLGESSKTVSWDLQKKAHKALNAYPMDIVGCLSEAYAAIGGTPVESQ
jgi:hypothetical protein